MSFKVYRDLGDGKQEVRRFSLHENVATRYNILLGKIYDVFDLSGKNPLLFWKDSDGDSVSLSSDLELREAVAESVSNSNVQLVRIIMKL